MKKFKNILVIFMSIVIVFGCFSCTTPKDDPINKDGVYASDIVLALEEAELSFKFLYEEANTTKDSPGYGLVRDRFPGSPSTASIASVGFALGAFPAAIENKWITKEQAEERVLGTLTTLESLENYEGFYYHFVNMYSGKGLSGSEISGIDTALLIGGVLVVGEYFGGAIQERANALYERINWNFYVGSNNGKKQFRMSYTPQTNKFSGFWDWSGEQLIMYVLGAGAPKEENRIDKDMLYSFNRPTGTYKNKTDKFIYSWNGSIFTHQFSHAFIDFRGLVDEKGVDWFENSVNATKNAREFCIDQASKHAGYGENSWGLTACDTPKGYNGALGALPSGSNTISKMSEGTIAPGGAIGSMIFLPKEVMATIRHYSKIENLTGRYGFYDAFNFSGSEKWIARDVIGIDKGISVMMITNYVNDYINSNYFMQSEYIKNAITRLGFTQKTADKVAA